MARHVTQRSATRAAASEPPALASRVPPHAFFMVSAVFHYLGPAFAVLLFAAVAPLGVAWLRIASAAVVFALWRRPWRLFLVGSWRRTRILIALGVVLALMNACFYLAIARLPLGTVGAIEFLGPILLAVLGLRTRRNVLALLLAVAGVWLLTDVRLAGQPVGFVFAFANCVLFIGYVVLGHRIANEPPATATEKRGNETGIDRLGAAMLVALVAITPLGLAGAAPTFAQPQLLLAGIGVGICSSVIPYVCDQLAMARLPRATFALLLALLPACATVIGAVVLRQIPTPVEIAGVALVIAGVAVHQELHEA
ncbi:MAG: Permease of the drug/metabolite transporter (DMT) superfamily [Ktedonobacterales bacterium]|nr:MAG: Permease of the drug/metabolite transporter (DMT) superfamily [Ktedonobacterales bacterium]